MAYPGNPFSDASPCGIMEVLWVGPRGHRMSDDNPATKSAPPGGGTSPAEPSSFQLQPGDRVGNYVIREQIGEGGFAVVYAAEQEKTVRRQAPPNRLRKGAYHAQQATRQERN